jgi:trimeric autotransporter adhesin
MTMPSRSQRRWSSLVVGAGVALAAVLVPVASSTTAQAADQVRDGRAESRALASCWEIKQAFPSSPDGLYWLYTPALQRPQQFWCDMTTDGGGWVLIGRGRQGWDFTAEGQGSLVTMNAAVTGTKAFAPQHLTNDLVAGLLNNTAPSSLNDGLRVRRATDAAGTTWQEVRLKFGGMTYWSWALGGGYGLVSHAFDGAVVAGGSSKTSCDDDAFRCVSTIRNKGNTYRPGFAYGSGVAGSTSASSYLWAATDGGGSAIPFAQAYLRPQLRLKDLAFPTVGTKGLRAVPTRQMFDNYARPQAYGVSGQANGFSTERDTEVRSMAQLGSRMFVGGNFAQVENYAKGTHTAQAYLAAFDAATGTWISSFRPTFNGKVNAVAKLPGGALAVGGEFTKVNGSTHMGLVVLDPATGKVARGFGAQLQYRSSKTTKPGTVTALAVSGSYLYLGGSFTHVAGGSPLGKYVYAKRGARLSGSGKPDATWNPAFNSSPIFITTSAKGDRIYYGGFFTTMKDGADSADRFVALRTTAPAQKVTGLHAVVTSTTPRSYQQTGVEAAGRFWLGGSEHMFYDFSAADLSLVRPNISRSDDGPGGDFQASVVAGGIAYGSCHCSLSYVYGNAVGWNPPTHYDRVDTMRYIAAFDVRTGKDLPDYMPWISTRAVRGPWAMTVDTSGCLWAGGDLTRSRRTGDGHWQTSNGFARFCRTDATPPTAPSTPKVVVNKDKTVTVSWAASSDRGSGVTGYTVFRDNYAVATVTGRSARLPVALGTSRYAVRATDAAGNIGATSPSVRVVVH